MWTKGHLHSPIQDLSLTLRFHPQGLREIREFESKLQFLATAQIHETGEPEAMEPPRMVRNSNSHQLFIGNLPHENDKSELKDFYFPKL